MRFLFLLSFILVSVFLFPSQTYASGNYTEGSSGYDISYPQCLHAYPDKAYSFGVIGVTAGKAFTFNPCLQSEFYWAEAGSEKPTLYMNLNIPAGSTSTFGDSGPAGQCKRNNSLCQSYNYGYNAAENAYQHAKSQLVTASMWWLDIELANDWSDAAAPNIRVLQGASDYFSSVAVRVGIYSTKNDWETIMGTAYMPTQKLLTPIPNWVVGNGDIQTASFYCLQPFSSGSSVWLVQSTSGDFDSDYACPE